jgi:1-deoxy-D-xylulose-5-phosphate reductoisomerase
MGPKVTCDSALLLNKGLEMIEAHWLFGLPPENIHVVIHPQSIVHSLVEYEDGAYLAQLSAPDMRLPIQYALLYPRRAACPGRSMDLFSLGTLSFEPPDTGAFPCLPLAYEAAARGGNAGAAFNAAAEAAVEAFLAGQCGFMDVPERIALAMERFSYIAKPTLEDVLATDMEIRELLSPNIARLSIK